MPERPLKCIALPARPPIDKLIAFKRFQLDLGDQYRLRPVFCDTNTPTPAHFAKWKAICGNEMVYVLDLGPKKYHNIAGSASEAEMGFLGSHAGETWTKLMELANENNKGGKLKNSRHSVAKLIRDVYDVMFWDSHEIAFNHGMDVVDAFFFRQNQRSWESLFSDPAYRQLLEIWDGFGVSEAEVVEFTLPLYFRQLFLSGRSSAEITEKIGWWLKKAKIVDDCRTAARSKDYAFRSFSVQGKQAGLVHVNHVFEAEAFTYQWIGSGKLALGIIRQPTNHVHIQPSFRLKKVNLDLLAERLRDLEPGRWYYEKRFAAPMLMNGSRQFTGVAPSEKSDDALIFLTSQWVRF